jgi:hypothetical protein
MLRRNKLSLYNLSPMLPAAPPSMAGSIPQNPYDLSHGGISYAMVTYIKTMMVGAIHG